MCVARGGRVRQRGVSKTGGWRGISGRGNSMDKCLESRELLTAQQPQRWVQCGDKTRVSCSQGGGSGLLAVESVEGFKEAILTRLWSLVCPGDLQSG